MIILPLILSTIIVGAANFKLAQIGRTGVKIIIYFFVTSIVAVSIGLIISNIFKPGLGLDIGLATDVKIKEFHGISFKDTINSIIPGNLFKALVNGSILQIIFFAIPFGIGVSYLRANRNENIKKSGEIIFNVCDGIANIMNLFVNWILQFAPIGVFALIAVVFAEQGIQIISTIGVVIFIAYLGFMIHACFYFFILKVNKLSIKKFLGGAKEAILTAFVTRSSSCTLPVTMKCTNEQLGVNKSIYSFTLPLGATINMDGTALYQGISIIFISFAVGVNLGLQQQLMVLVMAIFASIICAGTPGAGTIVLFMILEMVGLPVEAGTPVATAFAMLLGVDAITEMGRTSVKSILD